MCRFFALGRFFFTSALEGCSLFPRVHSFAFLKAQVGQGKGFQFAPNELLVCKDFLGASMRYISPRRSESLIPRGRPDREARGGDRGDGRGAPGGEKGRARRPTPEICLNGALRIDFAAYGRSQPEWLGQTGEGRQ